MKKLLMLVIAALLIAGATFAAEPNSNPPPLWAPMLNSMVITTATNAADNRNIPVFALWSAPAAPTAPANPDFVYAILKPEIGPTQNAYQCALGADRTVMTSNASSTLISTANPFGKDPKADPSANVVHSRAAPDFNIFFAAIDRQTAPRASPYYTATAKSKRHTAYVRRG